MKTNTALKTTMIASPLKAQSVVRAKGTGSKRVLVSSLMLTSLVDAFSILVIFLLMNAKSGIEEIQLKKVQTLPQATAMDMVSKGIVLRIEDKKFFVDDEQVTEQSLSAKLEQAKIKFESAATDGKKAALIVQADKKSDFEVISPILRAGAAAGINQFKFATVEKQN